MKGWINTVIILFVIILSGACLSDNSGVTNTSTKTTTTIDGLKIEDSALLGMSLAEFYSEINSGNIRESYSLNGIIDEVLQTEHVTYVKLKDGDNELWTAVDKAENIPTGIRVVSDGTLIFNFPSQTLNRTFDLILFSTRIVGYDTKPASNLPTDTLMAGSPH